MDLKDKIIGMIKRSFGIKALTSIDEIENVDGYGMTITESSINSGISLMEQENDFNSKLKVDSNPISVRPNFQRLSNEIKMELLESFDKFKTTVFENNDIKSIKETEEEGIMGEIPFMCFAEMDLNGNLKSTIIVTKNSCIKNSEDDAGNISYMETRRGEDGIQTVINDNQGSMYINGSMSKEDIDMIKKFSSRNFDTITKLPKKFDELTREEYKNTLEKLGVKTDVDLQDKGKFNYVSTGKTIRNNGTIAQLNEMSCVFDKENLDKNPIIISINSLKDNKIVSRKFRLTENGKYIDESSFKITGGNPQYALLDYEQVINYGKEKRLDVNYFERARKFLNNKNNSLIPDAAVSIHEAMGRKQEREQKAQNEKLQGEDDKTL